MFSLGNTDRAAAEGSGEARRPNHSHVNPSVSARRRPGTLTVLAGIGALALAATSASGGPPCGSSGTSVSIRIGSGYRPCPPACCCSRCARKVVYVREVCPPPPCPPRWREPRYSCDDSVRFYFGIGSGFSSCNDSFGYESWYWSRSDDYSGHRSYARGDDNRRSNRGEGRRGDDRSRSIDDREDSRLGSRDGRDRTAEREPDHRSAPIEPRRYALSASDVPQAPARPTAIGSSVPAAIPLVPASAPPPPPPAQQPQAAAPAAQPPAGEDASGALREVIRADRSGSRAADRSGAISAMRGVVSANAPALRAAGDSLSRDESQRLRHARAFYEKPPLGTVSEQDARFMTAAISAALGESSAARSAVRLAQRKGDSGPAIAALAAAYAPPPAPTVAPAAPSPATPVAPALAFKDR